MDVGTGGRLGGDREPVGGRAGQWNGSLSLGRLCDVLLSALALEDAAGGATDDVALLVAQTKGLPADRVACFDIPIDRAAVTRLRAAAIRQLAPPEPDDLAFTTELIPSELATNAIRYATGPITVRLLLDRPRVCEVADGSSTSPHVRYATTTDEGGRGLFPVAHLSERWGARYTERGKIIWAEQRVP